MLNMKMLSKAGVTPMCTCMDHIILDKIIRNYGWQFVFDDKHSYEQISGFDKYEVQEE